MYRQDHHGRAKEAFHVVESMHNCHMYILMHRSWAPAYSPN